jgi:hypothetical protein
MTCTYFISGHLDLTDTEFDLHYAPDITKAMIEKGKFVVGDARGADAMAQNFLKGYKDVVVYHMFEKPRNNCGFQTRGGFKSDDSRDTAMTAISQIDIAWVRPGKENSGTAKNLKRRKMFQQR